MVVIGVSSDIEMLDALSQSGPSPALEILTIIEYFFTFFYMCDLLSGRSLHKVQPAGIKSVDLTKTI